MWWCAVGAMIDVTLEESSIKTLITGPHIYGHFIYDEDRTKIVVFSVNCAGLIGYSWEKWNLTSYSYHMQTSIPV